MHTPTKRAPNFTINEMAHSPRTPLNFSRELRQVLQERNLLTVKTRNKVCSMLNDSINNPEVDKRKSFRMQAVQEIINSEKTYLNQLEILMRYFVRPLKEQAIIDDVRHTCLFGQIEMIYNLNGELLRELGDNMDYVAEAFLKMAPFFKLYSVYAFDYRNALLTLQELTSKNPVFRKYLEQTESRPEVQRKLNSLMIAPIQRVPRYKLLLEQVLLYTSPADADFKLLKESVKQIESTVSHINSCIEDQEVTLMLINLQNSLVNRTPNIVKPSRKVIKEGPLQKISRNGTEIRRYCVLMSDIFMYCKILKERPPNTVVENSLELCCIFPLKKCKVYELFPGNFKVTCQGDGIIFGTTDLQLARAWVGFIRDAIDLHIQCRKTLRKESSKRTPMRKKDLKNFDMDYVLSPTRKKYDYEKIFRNKNRSSDSEDDTDVYASSCFSRKKIPITNKTLSKSTESVVKKRKPLKRPAPPPPPPPPPPPQAILKNAESTSGNSIAKLYKYIANDKVGACNVGGGILKRTSNADDVSSLAKSSRLSVDHDPTYGFASRYSDTKSYFRTHNVDTIPTAVKRETFFADGLGDGNFRDALFPLRSSGGSNKSTDNSITGWFVPGHGFEKENATLTMPPQKKRVKFDDSLEPSKCTKGDKETPFVFPAVDNSASAKASLREKIYDFFTKLF